MKHTQSCNPSPLALDSTPTLTRMSLLAGSSRSVALRPILSLSVLLVKASMVGTNMVSVALEGKETSSLRCSQQQQGGCGRVKATQTGFAMIEPNSDKMPREKISVPECDRVRLCVPPASA